MNPHRIAEIAITRLLRKPAKLNMLRMLNILFLDEVGQLSAEIFSTLDIIFIRVHDNNIFLEGLLLVVIVDCTQLQLVKGRSFLLFSHDINCFKMINLSDSGRAYNDAPYVRVHEISRMYYKDVEDNPELLEEFKELLSETCTFIDTWSSSEVTP